jgi:hypothetical protein
MTGALLIDRALDLNTFEAAGRAARRKRVREAIALGFMGGVQGEESRGICGVGKVNRTAVVPKFWIWQQ